MAQTIILPVEVQGLEWSDLRKGIKDCIKSVTPLARIYSSWPLKYDVGQTKNLLMSKADGGKVHAWIISINKAIPYNKKAGGYALSWDLNVRIWGFLGYAQTHNAETQDTIEKEVKAITQVLFLNQKHLALEDASALHEVGMVEWEEIDVEAFGSGDDVHVAKGNLDVTIMENFSL